MDELEVPQHVQQLQQLSSLLQNDKADSDSVTWVPELIPKFVQKAVEAVCSPTGKGRVLNSLKSLMDEGSLAQQCLLCT
jgi:hypothetical protein